MGSEHAPGPSLHWKLAGTGIVPVSRVFAASCTLRFEGMGPQMLWPGCWGASVSFPAALAPATADEVNGPLVTCGMVPSSAFCNGWKCLKCASLYA